MSFTLTGPLSVTPGVAYVYTVCGYNVCVANEVQGTPEFPPDWTVVSQTPIVGNCYTITVIAGSTPPLGGALTIFDCACSFNLTGGYEVASPQLRGVTIGNTIASNIGICCSQFAKAFLDASQWINNTGNPVTLTITFGNHVDAVAALGAYSFTSTANLTIAACFANLVSQINAAAAANPSGNPEGPNPASYIGGIFSMVSFPTPNDATPCGNTTNYLYGFQVTCNNISFDNNTANFINGGQVINCIGPPSITGNPFVCEGQQTTFTVTFPLGIPQDYTITPPAGWTLVSTVVSGPNTLLVNLIPNSQSGVLTVSDTNGVSSYSTSLMLINDCFIADCASKMLLSQFCHDQDPCCTECNDLKKKEKEIEAKMMNKAIGLLTSYSLAKQNYFITCNNSDLNNILNILNQIKSILIRCGICPQI